MYEIPPPLSLSFEREGRGWPQTSTNMKGHAMTNNETKQDLRGACRCLDCQSMSAAYGGNGKGLLFDLNDLEAGPLRDLEVNA